MSRKKDKMISGALFRIYRRSNEKILDACYRWLYDAGAGDPGFGIA